ncbi:MAG: DUF748 domain-containing protein [Nitrospiraceae bacterium]
MEDQIAAPRSPWKRMGKTTKWALILAVCVGLYAVIGFLIIPSILRSKLESILTEQLNRPVAIREVLFNPFALSLTVRGFTIDEQDNSPLLGFEELYVNVELASLVNQALTFSAIELQQPYVVAEVRKDGRLNLQELRPSASASHPPSDQTSPVPPEEAQEEGLPGVIIELLHIDRGIVEFHDDSKPTPFTADIVPITFTLLNFSTKPVSPDALSFTAEIGPGEKIEWHGTLYVQPLQSEGTLNLTGIKARTLWTYIQDRVKFEITDGSIDVTASYRAKSDREGFQATVKEAAVKLTQFALGIKNAQQPLITIPEFGVEGIEADLVARQAHIAAVRSRDARITGWLDSERRTIFQTLFAGDATNATPAEPPASKDTDASSSTPWAAKIDQVSIENYGIVLEDRKPPTPVLLTFNPLTLKLANVSSQLDAKVDLDLFVRFNDTGKVAVTGGFTPQPFTADLDLDVSKIALAPFQPYIDPIAQLTLHSGAADLKGRASYRATDTTKPRLRFKGRVGVTELLTQDKLLNKDFLKWNELAVNGLELDVEPTRVKISEIVTRKPYLRFIIGPDRSTNIQAILIRQDSAQATAENPPPPTEPVKKQSAAEAVPVQIGAIRIIDGSTHFADFSLRPVIDTGIFGLNGTIKGLSSKELTKGDVSVEGTVDKYAPVLIKGQINPLTSDAFTDVAMSVKNVELTTVSPYSTKFAGYPIIKGKISLDLQYKLSQKVLEAENKVVINQLTLGEKVDSSDATSLPVKLAIALLQDRNGVIDIDLPVRGDLNNPDFHYGQLVWHVLGNLITKAVTAPFNLIAGLVGGSGEELNTVAFPVGSSELAAASEANLNSIAKALADRPGLNLEITGAGAPGADGPALAEAKLREELLLLKRQSAETTGKPGPEGADVAGFTESEETSLVETLYTKKFGALPSPPVPTDSPPSTAEKPRTVPVAELKARLLNDIKVDEGQIRLLAQDRAKRIQDFVVTQGGIAPERVFLLDTVIDASASGDSVPCKLGLNAG